MSSTETFDYIVVGAGSSGATVARRLADAGKQVLLLEAGAPRQRDFWVRTPLGIAKLLLDPKYVWPFNTQGQAFMHGQKVYWPRGRLPGGSSSVNGMIYVRGDPAEYDRWRDLGNAGWAYADLLPYFKRLESFAEGDPRWRGHEGPIGVTHLRHDPQVLGSAFVDACRLAGIPETADYNGAQYEGVSYLQLNTKDGQRCGTARGYLEGPLPPSLTLRTRSQATRILWSGRRAVGIAYVQDGQSRQAHVRAELIVSAGPIKSPQLLEVSGIGQRRVLDSIGVTLVHELPGVGENLLDHVQARVSYRASRRVTLNEIMASPWRPVLMGMGYLMTRRGIMATPSATAHALVRTDEADPQPTVKIQMHHVSGASRYASKRDAGLDPFPGFSIGVFQLRPQSRGWVHATGPDALRDPAMDPHYLQHELDRRQMVDGLRLARRVAAQGPLADLITEETRPGPGAVSDQELLDYIRETGQTSWHPIGTCKMGTDEAAVVDPTLRVRGVQALRVVDSSIMPTMPSSNTNAASIAIGEKAADLLLEASP